MVNLVIHDVSGGVAVVVGMHNYHILDSFSPSVVQLGNHLHHLERSQYNCFHESYYVFEHLHLYQIVSVLLCFKKW